MGQRIEGGGDDPARIARIQEEVEARATKEAEEAAKAQIAKEAREAHRAAVAKITAAAKELKPHIDALAKGNISIDEIKNDPTTYNIVADGCAQKPKGVETMHVDSEKSWAHLLTNKDRDEMVQQFQRYFKNNVIFLK